MLRKYQKEDLVKWIRNNYRGGWYWEPGLGKTFTIAFVIKQMLKKKRAHRAFFAGPLLAVSTLQDFLTDVMGIPASMIYNYATEKKDFTDKHRIFIINYELLPPPKNKPRTKVKSWFDDDGVFHMEAKKLGPIRKVRPYPEDIDLWALDESHMLKSHSSNAFKFFQTRIKNTDKVICLSGTPFPNRHVSCYTQLHLMKPGVLGKNISRFRENYCRLVSKQYGTYKVKSSKVPEIEQIANELVTVRKASDHLDLPDHTDINLTYKLTPEQITYINILKKDGIALDADDKDILLSSITVARIMTQQILSGYINMKVTRAVVKDKVEIKREFSREPKFSVLKQLLESLGGKKLIVCVYFTDTSAWLKEALTKEGYKVDRFASDDKDNFKERLKAFTHGNVQVLISHPSIIGIALNDLVKANYLLWYELTDNWAVYKQMVNRIHRFGQMNPTFCYHLIGHPIEHMMLQALKEKADVNDRLAKMYFDSLENE